MLHELQLPECMTQATFLLQETRAKLEATEGKLKAAEESAVQAAKEHEETVASRKKLQMRNLVSCAA